MLQLFDFNQEDFANVYPLQVVGKDPLVLEALDEIDADYEMVEYVKNMKVIAGASYLIVGHHFKNTFSEKKITLSDEFEVKAFGDKIVKAVFIQKSTTVSYYNKGALIVRNGWYHAEASFGVIKGVKAKIQDLYYQSQTKKITKIPYALVDRFNYSKLIENLTKLKFCVLDTETYQMESVLKYYDHYAYADIPEKYINPHSDGLRLRLIGLMFSTADIWVIPVPHETHYEHTVTDDYKKWYEDNLDKIPNDYKLSIELYHKVMDALLDFFQRSDTETVIHYSAFDLHVLASYFRRYKGIDFLTKLKSSIIDTHNLQHIVDCDDNETRSLKDANNFYSPRSSEYEKPLHEAYNNHYSVWFKAKTSELSTYLAFDLACTNLEYLRLNRLLTFDLKLDGLKYFYKNYKQLVKVPLTQVEQNGLPIDLKFIQNTLPHIKDLAEYFESKFYNSDTYKKAKVLLKIHYLQGMREEYVELDVKIANLKDNPIEVAKLKRTQIALIKSINEVKTSTIESFELDMYKSTHFAYICGYLFKTKHKANENFYKGHAPYFYTGGMGFNDLEKFLRDENLDFCEEFRLITYVLVAEKIRKLSTTYLEAFERAQYSHDKRLHPTLKDAHTATDRLSSANPNAQNIPAWSREHNEFMRPILRCAKRSFRAPAGKIFAEIDYTGFELAFYAYISNAKKLSAAFKAGIDTHVMTAKQIGRISDEEWAALDSRTAKTMRNELGKTYNFSLIYFISPFGLRYNIEAKQGQLLDLDVIESRIESFFNLYPEIRHRHNAIRNFAKDYQETFTLMGFRRPLNVERIKKTEMKKPYNRHKDKDALNETVNRAIEKKAINTECQGTTGEICVTALAILTKLISEHSLLNGHMKIVLTVHDSIYFEFTDDPIIVSTGLKLAQEVMTKTVFEYCYDKFHFNPLALTKISVEASLGYSLDDTLEIKGSLEVDNIKKYLTKRELFTLDSELVSKIKQGIDTLKTIY